MSFVSIDVTTSGALPLPAGNASVIYLVRGGQGRIDLLLPPAASTTSRLLTVRRLDERGRVLVRAAGGESIEGAREVRENGSRDSDALALDARGDYVTLVTDGSKWFVVAEGR